MEKLLLLAPCLGWRCEGASPSGQAVFNSRYTSVQKDEPTRQGPVSLLSWIPGRGASMADGVEIHGLTGRAQTLRDGGLSRAQGSMKLEPPAVGQAGNGSPPLGHAMCRRPPCFPPTGAAARCDALLAQRRVDSVKVWVPRRLRRGSVPVLRSETALETCPTGTRPRDSPPPGAASRLSPPGECGARNPPPAPAPAAVNRWARPRGFHLRLMPPSGAPKPTPDHDLTLQRRSLPWSHPLPPCAAVPCSVLPRLCPAARAVEPPGPLSHPVVEHAPPSPPSLSPSFIPPFFFLVPTLAREG